MDKQLKRILIIVFGWIFLILGVAGLFLPFLQGILFLLVGFYLLSKESEWADYQFKRLKKRYPRLYDKFTELKDGFIRKYRQLFRSKV